jgi:Domain of unknown function (DUF4249)
MKMKSLPIIFLIALCLFCSCTKVIELDLNSSDPQTVIEGNIGTTGDSTLIKITKSVNFDESNNFPLVQNAIVTVSDNAGNSETLVEISAGNYSSSTFLGAVGRTYYLNVSSEGKTFTAQSAIPIQVNFDSLMVEKITSSGGGPGGGQGGGTTYKVTVQYADPSNQTNYYRFIEYHNGEPQGNIFVFDDHLANGQSVSTDLISFNRKLNSGDTLTIEMQCIDKPVYEYFHSFGNLFGGPQNASTPANPYTNIIGSKLGYFSAHTTQKITLVVP